MFSVLVVSKWCKLGGWEMLLLIKESTARMRKLLGTFTRLGNKDRKKVVASL